MNRVIAQEYCVLGNNICVQTKLNLKPKIIVKIIGVGIGTHEKRLYRDKDWTYNSPLKFNLKVYV